MLGSGLLEYYLGLAFDYLKDYYKGGGSLKVRKIALQHSPKQLNWMGTLKNKKGSKKQLENAVFISMTEIV